MTGKVDNYSPEEWSFYRHIYC